MTTQKTSRRRIRRSGRRGIVILIVISLLVLFMLMMVTFAVIAGHYREAARAVAFHRSAQVKFAENNAVMDDILTMILGEPASPSSSLFGTSLLGDMYGRSVNGIVAGVPAGPQLEGAGAFVSFSGFSDTQTIVGAQFANSEDYYAGCVITMKDGPCAGLSSRITHYYPGNRPTWLSPVPAGGYSVDDALLPGDVNDPIALRMEAFENGLLPQVGNRFVVNDKPFNGTGLGRPASGAFSNDGTDGPPTNFEWALMPHLAGWPNRVNARLALAGGADEPWDSYDFQNMFLALVPSDPVGPMGVKPSYHDPALLAYWYTRFDMSDGVLDDTPSLYDPTNPAAVALLRRIMFRPLQADHPNFDGSNLSFDPSGATGRWDVDNDNDGIADSIWIDPGLPVSIAPDGRRYKRLVAIMIRDLDGRVQLNAHGNTEWAKDFARPTTGLPDPIPATPAVEPLAGAPLSPSFVPRGQGFGPAEINFSNLFEIDGGPSPLLFYQRMFQGTASNPFPPMTPVVTAATPGKYGLDTYPLQAGYNPLDRRPGIWGPNGGGVVSNDALAVIKAQGFGYDYNGTVFSNYATPSDIWGRGAIALDYAGQPYPYSQAAQTDWDNDGTPDTVEIIDNPYEINLIDGPQSYDSPYTVAEQERLLRRFDADADVLPQRLYEFFNTSGNPVTLARRINTTSVLGSSVSAPRAMPPLYMRQDPATYGNPGASILEICEARVGAEVGALGRSGRQYIVKQLMPFEFYQGQMFNLNRPFGNGVDDNNNGVVDEPGEADNINGPLEPAWTSGIYAAGYTSPPNMAAYLLNDAQDHWWDPAGLGAPYDDPNYASNLINSNPHLYSRQLFARNLYCLLMLNCDVDNYVTTSMPNPEGLNPGQLRKLFCRRVAQYAINVVDFRDPDAIMTPFEYDEFPFDGWNVDGDLTTDENNLMGSTHRGVVWGMEQQDLVLKETISFHDRRVRDTAHDSTAMDRAGGDPTLDQIRLPQGSTFIELVCTRARVDNNVKLPVELYNPLTGRLDLARMAPVSLPPAQGADGSAHPVWQIAISENVQGAATDNRPNTLSSTQLDTFSLEPTLNPSVPPTRIQASIYRPGPAQFVPIERYIWFTNAEPAAATGQADNTFINSLGWDVSLNPGSYLVIGPRPATSLGSEVTAAPTPMYDGPSPQTINLSDPSGPGVTISNIASAPTSLTPGDQIRQAVAMVADIHPPRAGVATIGGPTAWPAARRIGLNVTEPLPQSGRYYTFPTDPNDAYDSLTMPTMNTFPDNPFDSTGGMPLEAANMLASKTYAGTHTMVLQRLANPTQAWHPVTNPYINLDWAENDTTVFSGDEDTDRQVDVMGAPQDVDPDDPTPHDPAMFRTRQRGNTNTAAGYANGMLWNPQTERPTAPAAETAESPAAVYFKHSLVHTFGFVNGIYRDPAAPTPAQNESVWPRTPGVPLVGGIASPLWNFTVAKRVPTDPDVPAMYVGDPSLPFPWITHNNRPYANPLEMLVVPASSPQRICQEFLYAFPGNTYDASVAPPTSTYGLYWHLPNFFLSTIVDPNTGAVLPGSDFHRLFDYVETPSPYVGAESWYPPTVTNDMAYTSPVTLNHVGTGYRAPFNRLSRFRDPGKVNINTIIDPLVWDAIVASFPEMQSANGWEPLTTSGGPLFAQILQSRRGYATGADTGATSDMFLPNANYPTIVANPFRPADAFDLQPLADMQLVRPADATLLRGNGTPLPLLGGDPPTPGNLPLFNFNQYNVNLADPTTFDQFGRATDRNAYFHYQPFAKLANMLTTNSNTFSVWMTVGYFEVEPNPAGVDVAHPDGYQLGQEMLFDGVYRRPRAFFLIDRSIPVGFEPGRALNVDKCVLQRRYIE